MATDAKYAAAATAAFPVTYNALKVAPAKWAASAASADYNTGTAASSVNTPNPDAVKMTTQLKCVAAAYGAAGKGLYEKDKAPAPPAAGTKPTDKVAKYVWTEKNNGLVAAKKAEVKKADPKPAETKKADPKAAPAKDAKAADAKKDAKATAVPDGPGKCVKEALCDTQDAKTSAKITCDAVRLGAAALAALAVASTL
jgi:hypothetical protein